VYYVTSRISIAFTTSAALAPWLGLLLATFAFPLPGASFQFRGEVTMSLALEILSADLSRKPRASEESSQGQTMSSDRPPKPQACCTPRIHVH
jgi:hypothetical protein